MFKFSLKHLSLKSTSKTSTGKLNSLIVLSRLCFSKGFVYCTLYWTRNILISVFSSISGKLCGNEVHPNWYIWKTLVLFLSLFQVIVEQVYHRLKKMHSWNIHTVISCAHSTAMFQPSQPVCKKKCFPLAGADSVGDTQSATLGELHWLMQKVLRAALCRRDRNAKVWLRACLASQVSSVGDLQEQHSSQYAQHLLFL